jgi:regulatory protein YycI of two-component signal transduction system YycFG
MGLSAGTAVVIAVFLLVGFLLAGLLFQPKASVDAWQVKESDFPVNSSNEEKLKFLLNYAVLAPSNYNTQPWKFNVSGNDIEVFSDKTRWLTFADADQREFYISIGCALENLLIAAGHFGYIGEVQYFPEPNRTDLVATVRLIPGGKLENEGHGLFQSILERHTNRQPYENRTIPDSDLRLLNNTTEKGFWLNVASDPKIKSEFRDLEVRADTIQYDNIEYKSELGYWLGQGVMGPTGIQAKIAQFEVLFLDVGKDQTKKDSDLLNSTFELGIITSSENDRTSQVKAGQLLERVWLVATASNIRVQPMSQVIEVPQIKAELAKLVPDKGSYLQQTFRLGYAPPETELTPRRPLKEVLV